MNQRRVLGLLDSHGKPLDARIERAVLKLLPKLRRRFPNVQDDVAEIEILEEAARRIAGREAQGGQIEKLNGYAWSAVRCVATSYLRKPSTKLIHSTLPPKASAIGLSQSASSYGSPEEIERAIAVREALEQLSEQERLVCTWKTAGFSAQEIADFLGRSVVAVDTLFSRAKAKLRRILSSEPQRTRHGRRRPTKGGARRQGRRGGDHNETSDGRHRPGTGEL
jgi:RNA polymerase sigma factor (sigma-70 family)